MNEEHAALEKINSITYSWRIGCIQYDKTLLSEQITFSKSSNIFCFQISPCSTDIESGTLYFCEKIKGAFKTYDFVAVLKYKSRKRDIFVVKRNVNPDRNTDWFLYEIRTLKTHHLEEVLCTIFQSDASSNIAEEKKLDTLTKNLKGAFLSEEDSDITIKVGDKKYPAHKLILRSRSPVFHRMLQHDMLEKNESIINISDCTPEIFRDFLLYLYTGKVDKVTKKTMLELYYVSHKYNVNGLRLDCVDFILKNLDNDNICDVITLATRHLESEMLQHAITFFTCNAQDIFTTTKWQEFIKRYPIQANELIIKTFDAKETSVCYEK